MTKEYLSPKMETMIILPDASVLSVSVTDPVIEDFSVSDGQW